MDDGQSLHSGIHHTTFEFATEQRQGAHIDGHPAKQFILPREKSAPLSANKNFKRV
jgi:hypothetical protein